MEGFSRKTVLPSIVEEWMDGFLTNPEVCVEEESDCYLYGKSLIGFLGSRRARFNEYFTDSYQLGKFIKRIQRENCEQLKVFLKTR